MTKEELIAKMYERSPAIKERDKMNYLKKAIILYFKRNCAFMLNASDSLIQYYTSQIQNCVRILKDRLDVIVGFNDDLDYGYLNHLTIGGTKRDRIMEFGFNDTAEGIVRQYARHFELRSTYSFGGIKFRLYVDGENPPGSAEYTCNEAVSKMLDKMISMAYDTNDVFSDADLMTELNTILSGEIRIWH